MTELPLTKRKRFLQVRHVLEENGFGQLLGGKVAAEQMLRHHPAKRLTKVLEELDGGFLLLAKLLSIRIDLIPPHV